MAKSKIPVEVIGQKPDPVIAMFPPNFDWEWHAHCARCGSSAYREDCEICGGDGVDGHDCGEDCCCCRYPEENVTCQYCRGRGHWYECVSSRQFCQSTPKPGREDQGRGAIEWYAENNDGCLHPGCDALHHKNENADLPCPWKAG